MACCQIILHQSEEDNLLCRILCTYSTNTFNGSIYFAICLFCFFSQKNKRKTIKCEWSYWNVCNVVSVGFGRCQWCGTRFPLIFAEVVLGLDSAENGTELVWKNWACAALMFSMRFYTVVKHALSELFQNKAKYRLSSRSVSTKSTHSLFAKCLGHHKV